MLTRLIPLLRNVCVLGLLVAWCLVLAQAPAPTPGADRSGPATSMSVLSLAAPRAPDAPLPLTVLSGMPDAAGIDEVARVPLSQFKPLEPGRIYPVAAGQPLWLGLRVLATGADDRSWVLAFVPSFLNRVELFYPDTQNRWQVQRAGDNLTHNEWTQPVLYPQFALPALPPGEHNLYIRLAHDVPQKIAPRFGTAREMQIDANGRFLIAGMLLGMMGLMVLISLMLAWSYRDHAYAWYALFVLLASLAGSTYLGSAQYLFWPQSRWWASIAIMPLVNAAIIAQLVFCVAMFLRQAHHRRQRRWALTVVGLACVLTAVHLASFEAVTRLSLFALAAGPCMVMIFWVVLSAWRNGAREAVYWLVAYVPLALTLMAALLEHLGLVDVALPYVMPVLSLAFEAPVLLLALHLHAKDRHAQRERESAIATIDPLTGFLTAQAFQQRLQSAWGRAQVTGQDICVAYIDVPHTPDVKDPESALRLERKLLRSVRLLRTITRETDVVARLRGTTLAVVMPGIPMGEELGNRLSRLVALGMMVDKYDQHAQELRFRIAVGTRFEFGEDLARLDTALREELAKEAGWTRRPIHYVQTGLGTTGPRPETQPATT